MLSAFKHDLRCCSHMQGEDSLSTEARRNATFLFHAHLRSTLAAKRVLSEYRLTQEAFAWLVGEIETRFQTVRTVCMPYRWSKGVVWTLVLCIPVLAVVAADW